MSKSGGTSYSGGSEGAVTSPSSKAKILAFTEGNEEFARQIVGEFLRITPPLLENIKEALKKNDRESLTGGCHRLKGNLAYLGEDRVLEIVSGIDCNDTSSEKLEPFFTEINEMLERLAKEWELHAPLFSSRVPQSD